MLMKVFLLPKDKVSFAIIAARQVAWPANTHPIISIHMHNFLSLALQSRVNHSERARTVS